MKTMQMENTNVRIQMLLKTETDSCEGEKKSFLTVRTQRASVSTEWLFGVWSERKEARPFGLEVVSIHTERGKGESAFSNTSSKSLKTKTRGIDSVHMSIIEAAAHHFIVKRHVLQNLYLTVSSVK